MPVSSNQFIPKSTVTVAGASNTKITNLSLPVANTEVSHSFQSGLKSVIIRSRTRAKLQFAFTSTESGTNYITIPNNASLWLQDLSFAGETLYIQSDKVATVEILELYT